MELNFNSVNISDMSEVELKALKELLTKEIKNRKIEARNNQVSPSKIINGKRLRDILGKRKELNLSRDYYGPDDGRRHNPGDVEVKNTTLLDAMTCYDGVEKRSYLDSLNICNRINYICDIALSNYYIVRAPRKGFTALQDKTIKRYPLVAVPEDRVDDYKSMVNELYDVFEKYANIATEKYSVLGIEKDWD